MIRINVIAAAISVLLLPFLYGTGHAQSTNFIWPSAGVMDRGAKYIELDANPTFRSLSDGGTYAFAGRFIYGLTDKLELGLNAAGAISNPASPLELQPNLKYQLFNSGDWQLSIGGMAFLPLTHQEAESPFGMIYTVGQYQTHIAGNYSPAISAGGWGLINNSNPGSKAGVLLALSQPLILDEKGNAKLSFVPEFMSGNNTRFSMVNPGLVWNISQTTTLGVGYGFSNAGRQYDTALIWFGMKF